uniref:Uncharacterized protein n=1 Tax=Fagus sylvatica TaxID=28930 RepID=A0A2N9HZZ0_FAGSY
MVSVETTVKVLRPSRKARAKFPSVRPCGLAKLQEFSSPARGGLPIRASIYDVVPCRGGSRVLSGLEGHFVLVSSPSPSSTSRLPPLCNVKRGILTQLEEEIALCGRPALNAVRATNSLALKSASGTWLASLLGLDEAIDFDWIHTGVLDNSKGGNSHSEHGDIHESHSLDAHKDLGL